MLDHMNLIVSDLASSKRFFTAALAPFGYKVLYDIPGGIGFGVDYPTFWINPATMPRKMHVAFAASNRAVVKAFYDAAVAAGGTEHGAPGLRPQYHRDYYGAFVLDPDGNIEAVCRRAE
jgi:catechol 2,3-dioxygenase-like lactoylglutathione lyase family enzyme